MIDAVAAIQFQIGLEEYTVSFKQRNIRTKTYLQSKVDNIIISFIVTMTSVNQ